MLVLVLLPFAFASFTLDFPRRNASQKSQIDACDLVGYTCIACSNVVGEFEGADYDKPVKLDNGMIFTFNEYNYSYSYRPEVAIFFKQVTYQGKTLNSYKLWIEDEVYDVTREK
jgi:hypothetical protein